MPDAVGLIEPANAVAHELPVMGFDDDIELFVIK
jgi:hypothetical protein